MKPELTIEQKERYNNTFKNLINRSSQDVIDFWGDREVDFSTGEPNTYGFETKLIGEMSNEYQILHNKALNRTL